jgi:phosphoribosylglycinamide formyltransferase-1
MARLKLGVLISGRGSNLQALIAACARPEFPAEIVLVVSNRPEADGLEHARAAGIETRVIAHGGYPDRETFDRDVSAALEAAGVELVCLAGFMRLLSPWFVETWRDRVVNIHPSLLPAFKGTDAHAQALAAGVRLSGCTVHIVRPEMDAGPILVQAAVPVLPDDDAESLSARILAQEHRCYPLAVRLIAEGRVRIEGDRAVVDAASPAGDTLVSPDA